MIQALTIIVILTIIIIPIIDFCGIKKEKSLRKGFKTLVKLYKHKDEQ